MSTTAEIEQESKPTEQDTIVEPAAMTTVDEVAPTTLQAASQEPVEQVNLPEHVCLLKEAFPDTDIEVIEAVLQAQHDNVESSFEILLGISDPSYSAPSVPAPTAVEQTPPMPPRPQSRQNNPSGNAPYAYRERQAQPAPTTVEEQLRMDEELAKQLALEDERNTQQRRRLPQQPQPQPQSQRQNIDDDDDSLFNLQEELPIIKEKMKEAVNAAKKKMVDLCNQFKANTQKNHPQNSNEKVATSSMPTTHAQYRGLPSDDGDDLLTGDISALHLSDYDVYAKTNGRPRENDVIHVNPPLGSPTQNMKSNAQAQTSTSDAQLKADEDFARQLAEEEQIQEAAVEDTTLHAPQMPTRKPLSPTVVIAPRSPLEFEGDSDYEDIGLTAAAPSTNTTTTKRTSDTNNTNLEESASVPYVIGDDDDSDSDDLVDIEEDEFKEEDKDDTVSKEGTSATINSSPTAANATTTLTKPTVDKAETSSTH